MNERRHLASVPDCGHAECVGKPECQRPEPKCRWADGEHGPCGGPSNGRECWDHRFVGREDMEW